MAPKKVVNKAVVKEVSSKNTNKSIEEMYQSMTQEQHILARPDTYVGDIQPQVEAMYVYDDTSDKIIERLITYVPGLYKIFDEILVNARDQAEVDNTCDTIMVNVNAETNEISVYNNGKGIDIAIHSEHKIYVPELIFGKLLTSTNYDDTEQRTTGGRNGYGAKLTNIFSSKFVVETLDFSRKLKFTQEFTNNMSVRSQAIVEPAKTCKSGYTKITFIPDFSKFKLNGLTSDIISLFKKRVYDLAGVSNKCKVYYNDKKIECKDFKSYIGLYHFDDMPEDDTDSDQVSNTETYDDDKIEAYKLFFEQVNSSWEVGFMYAPDAGNKQISFINGICTYHGGTHVNYVQDIVVNKLKDIITKKYKDITIKPNQIKENLIVFIKCIIVNPSFTSQTKETLKTKVSDFGSQCNIKDTTLSKFAKSGILNQVVNLIKLKEQAILKKTDGKKVTNLKGIPKLEDANKAGGKESNLCKLILTEGDSAKALAMSGRAVIGSDYYGIFPLKGKLLNVREATAKQLLENEEIINIKKIMGLQHEKEYDDISTLRYGGIILMTDQDQDGYHIKGLLLNFIHYFWPSLLKVDDFVTCLTTPIVKATKGKEIKVFYNLTDYEEWKKTIQGKWQIKYYKGLGTSDAKEAREYFTDINDKLINYLDDSKLLGETFIEQDSDNESGSESENDAEQIEATNIHTNLVKITMGVKAKYQDPCTESITLAFDKKRANDRKVWLGHYSRNNILNNSQKKVPVSDFINKELIHFSNEDNNRSIPSLCDGLKPSQRKVLYGTILKKLNTKENEIRVAQLAGFVSERTCYHHGEASLTGTITNMAQNFVGSNNINLLYPSGQFGTRLMGGKDHASPRYIHTYLAELTKLLFRPEDEPILKYLDDDGIEIEPEYFIPIIPTVLINGTEGIGTGYSTKIPNYDPLVVIDNLLSMIDDKPVKRMIPWYKNFKGTVLQVPDKQSEFMIYGCISKLDNSHVKVTELPIGTWTTDYREDLDKLEASGMIMGHIANNTEETVDITIEIDPDKLALMLSNNSIYTKLKLVTKRSTGNMHLYNSEGMIQKYSSPIEILEDFYAVRYDAYVARKQYIVGKLTKELNILEHKVRFIQDILSKRIIIERKKKTEIIARLEELNYPKLAIDNDKESYDYLINIPILSLSEEKINELEDKYKNKEQELIKVNACSEEETWKRELHELRENYLVWLENSKIQPTQYVSGDVSKKKQNTINKSKSKSKKNDVISDI
jgi:DNA topoisomerase-2